LLRKSVANLQTQLNRANALVEQREADVAKAQSESSACCRKIEQQRPEMDAVGLSGGEVDARLRAELGRWSSRYTEVQAAKEDDEGHIAALGKRLQNMQAAKARHAKEAEEFRFAVAKWATLTAQRKEEERQAIADAQAGAVAALRRQLGTVRTDFGRDRRKGETEGSDGN
jgi:predicted  nucleic acid-binding Zn-ribbon protein